MASTLNVSALPDYIEVHKDELLVKAALGAKTLDYVEIMPNVKYKDALNYIDSTVEFGDGSLCSWDPKGSDTFSQRTIEVKPIKVEKEFCAMDFRKKFANYQMLFEAGRETLPFEEKIADSNVEAIKAAVEKAVWQGDDTLGIEGYLKQIDTDVTNKTEVPAGTTATVQIETLVSKLSERALTKGVNLFVAPSLFRQYVAEQNGNCCANRAIIDAASESIPYVGDSRITILPVMGLEGTKKSVAASKDALVYGTDVEGSEAVYRLWYDEKGDIFCMRVRFNCGTAIKFVDEVAQLKMND